jgi:hypothetical protein
MSNIIKQIALISLVAVLAVGCSDSLSTDLSRNVTFKANKDSYALGDTVKAVLQNNSSHSVTCGEGFQVQRKKHGKWKPVSFRQSTFFTLEGIELSPGNKKSYHFSLADSSQLFPPHSFSEGQYRITTDVSNENETKDIDYTAKTRPFHVSENTQH